MSVARTSLAFAGAALFAMLPAIAGASTFSVNPIAVDLGNGATNAVVNIVNTGTENVRFQVKGFVWDESPEGDLKLTPSADVIAFPSVFSLASGATRKLRIGSTVAPGAIEKAYRAFVEELPPLDAVVATGKGDTIIFRTKIGIPVFIRPTSIVQKAEIGAPAIKASVLSVDVNNAGTVHFIATKVRVHATSSSGAAVFGHEFSGWYVLAGEHRTFTVPVPPDMCSKIASLTVELAGDPISMTKKFDALQPDCAR